MKTSQRDFRKQQSAIDEILSKIDNNAISECRNSLNYSIIRQVFRIKDEIKRITPLNLTRAPYDDYMLDIDRLCSYLPDRLRVRMLYNHGIRFSWRECWL